MSVTSNMEVTYSRYGNDTLSGAVLFEIVSPRPKANNFGALRAWIKVFCTTNVPPNFSRSALSTRVKLPFKVKDTSTVVRRGSRITAGLVASKLIVPAEEMLRLNPESKGPSRKMSNNVCDRPKCSKILRIYYFLRTTKMNGHARLRI